MKNNRISEWAKTMVAKQIPRMKRTCKVVDTFCSVVAIEISILS